MSNIEFPSDLRNLLQNVAEHQNNQLRLCKTLVEGFKATKEQDISYMDGYMDTLLDFIEPDSDAEALYLDYIAHIATFNPKKAKEYIEYIEDRLGYKIHAAYAAAYVARDLHRGQKDKGNKDYFKSHLLPVGKNGINWKEKVVGLLHDAAEDTPNDVSTILQLVKSYLEKWNNNPDDRSWIEEFEDDFFTYPADKCHLPTDEEWEEVATALQLLNKQTASTREEYLSRISTNELALKVKLNDLLNNMDISRISRPTGKDQERLKRYKREYEWLLQFSMK
jgi:hypothetical protein